MLEYWCLQGFILVLRIMTQEQLGKISPSKPQWKVTRRARLNTKHRPTAPPPPAQTYFGTFSKLKEAQNIQ